MLVWFQTIASKPCDWWLLQLQHRQARSPAIEMCSRWVEGLLSECVLTHDSSNLAVFYSDVVQHYFPVSSTWSNQIWTNLNNLFDWSCVPVITILSFSKHTYCLSTFNICYFASFVRGSCYYVFTIFSPDQVENWVLVRLEFRRLCEYSGVWCFLVLARKVFKVHSFEERDLLLVICDLFPTVRNHNFAFFSSTCKNCWVLAKLDLE